MNDVNEDDDNDDEDHSSYSGSQWNAASSCWANEKASCPWQSSRI